MALNAIGSHHCINNSAPVSFSSSFSLTQAQPFTVVAVSERTVFSATELPGILHDAGVGTIRAGYMNAANQVVAYAGATVSPVTASDSHYHSLAYVYHDATSASTVYVDGTGTGVSLGATTGFSGDPGFLTNSLATQVTACEIGIYGSDIGATAATALKNNIIARYGVLP